MDFIYLRNKLKEEKKALIENSSIRVHDIDGAIKLACVMYRSAITNKLNGYIKSFRIRYWKNKKESKIMDLENKNFSKLGIRFALLGKIKGIYNGKEYNFERVNRDCKLQRIKGNYYLYVPEKAKYKKENLIKNKQITIDPGIRTFFTGITENKIVKIGDLEERIKGYLKRKDKIMRNELISERIKKKNERIINRKTSNIIDDLHWKTIKYLTDNNKIILMGNMSTKNISKKTGNLDKMSKRIGSSIRLYQFKQRL